MLSVYTFDLDVASDLARELGRLLNGDECKVRDRYVRQNLKDRYETAHGVLRLILSSHTSIRPLDIRFSRDEFGKPRLSRGSPTSPHLHFSLSHSVTIGCVAVSTVAAVGVDVEWKRVIPDAEGLLISILTKDERSVAQSSLKSGAFGCSEILQRCWTIKEAVLKAAGYGLSIDPSLVNLDLATLRAALTQLDQNPFGLCKTEIMASVQNWAGVVHVFSLPLGSGAVALGCGSGGVVPMLTKISAAWLTEALESWGLNLGCRVS